MLGLIFGWWSKTSFRQSKYSSYSQRSMQEWGVYHKVEAKLTWMKEKGLKVWSYQLLLQLLDAKKTGRGNKTKLYISIKP